MPDNIHTEIENDHWKRLALRLLEAGLKGDRRSVELSAIRTLRRLRAAGLPDAAVLGDVLAAETSPHRNSMRAKLEEPAPLDSDSGFGIVRLERVSDSVDRPILPQELLTQTETFIHEREQSAKLIAAGLTPPSTVLLSGPPGTGKTMLARWLAGRLSMRLATLDLATSVSSFLGKTGLNLRRALDFARAAPTLLLLDEFDSIAKRRDDASDIGELKRVVNILLKDLENWPPHSILVAATNHESLLDSAMFRRFEIHWRLEIPNAALRNTMICDALSLPPDDSITNLLAMLTEETSPADITTISNRILRSHVINGQSVEHAVIAMIPTLLPKDLSSKQKPELIRRIREIAGRSIPLRVLANWFGLTESTIHHHLNPVNKEPE